jgi:hypothetical protein
MNSVRMQTSAYHEGQVEWVEASLLQLQPSLPLTPTSLQQSCLHTYNNTSKNEQPHSAQRDYKTQVQKTIR